ncbi:hypothetical protein HW132_07055 [Brasilonema sp. CT11]|nr:hypothetical protein [Brasilonema sp. CT11]
MLQENKISFFNLVTEIAANLEGFTVEKIDSVAADDLGWLTIEHSDGRQLCLRHNRYDNKINIWGRYGQDAYGSSATPKNFGLVKYSDKAQDEINVSATRTAEAIAKDIKRRLLPYYSEYFYQITNRVTQQREKNDTTNQRITEIAQLLGSNRLTGKSNYTKTAYFSLGTINHGEIKTSNGDDYTLELRGISHALAVQIAQLLKTTQAE